MFRIVFGLLGFYGAMRFLAKGWVEILYLAPEHHLTYDHAGWVRPWPPVLMYGHVVVVGLAALAVAVGYRSRVAAVVYLIGFGYLELLDGALYLNHYWWVTLGAAWVVVLPLHHTWSFDVWRGRLARREFVPVLTVWILRAQLGVVYVFAGLAKLNPDWLGDGNPLGIWLANRSDLSLVGALLDTPGVGLAASWAGMIFDCTIVGWLLWRRSRPLAYVAVIVFHSVTGMLFQIGLFPVVMIAGTLVFFSPEWPVVLLGKMGLNRSQMPESPIPESLPDSGVRVSRLALTALAAVALLQMAVPLRHFGSSGNVRWTEEGYYLSWRVMLTEKTGVLNFEVTDPATGEVWRVYPEAVLTEWQSRQAAIRSDLLLATAHLIADGFAVGELGDGSVHEHVEVRAQSFVSFNGRRRQRYVNPDVDLAQLGRGAPAAVWILPLDEPEFD